MSDNNQTGAIYTDQDRRSAAYERAMSVGLKVKHGYRDNGLAKNVTGPLPVSDANNVVVKGRRAN